MVVPKFIRAENAENQPKLPAVKSKASIILYGGERTRAAAVLWYLEELGISYQYKKLNIAAGENKQPEYLAINPMGKVPSLVDNDFSVWESGAILWYLAAKYGQMPEDLATQAQINQWIIFANSTLGNGLFLEDRRETEMPRLLSPLNEILLENPYLMGESFTVADVAVGYYLYMAKLLFNLDWQEYPAVIDYLDRLTQRQAFKDTLGQR
ncbi:glutathione S-transferase family protein [Myxosarcina sp. GI1]|uniref:glutathione S-transferase family protein n=1 Tax=Myxosarcina sp. GI1 TaxID=1541065 RepID=UPI0009DE8525|nr:glutathione S-transferase family protein [Myxosarcina sp. GI1]